jgi:ribosome-associated heat shock protein Hsp15
LWHARFARTRTAAQRLAVSGHVRLNKQKVSSASRPVRPGDVLTLALGRAVVVLTVTGIAGRRGSADQARSLYVQHEPSVSGPGAPASRRTAPDSAVGAPRPAGRPSKRDRAQAAALKRRSGDI